MISRSESLSIAASRASSGGGSPICLLCHVIHFRCAANRQSAIGHGNALHGHANALLSHVNALLSHVNALLSHVNALLSHANALLSHVNARKRDSSGR